MPRPGRRTMPIVPALLILLLVALLSQVSSSLAVHEGDTRLTFEPVAGSPSPTGSGTGLVAYAGGLEPDTRWTVTLQFTGLEPETEYLALVAGRFGEDGSPEATAFSPICGFRTDAEGYGGCWYYLVGLQRLALVELRLGNEEGEAVLQASRQEGGPGSMTGTPNVHSHPLTATPAHEQDSHPASPVATP